MGHADVKDVKLVGVAFQRSAVLQLWRIGETDVLPEAENRPCHCVFNLGLTHTQFMSTGRSGILQQVVSIMSDNDETRW